MRRRRGPNKIGPAEATRGTETSKYPEEKKEKSIPQVAASERGGAQTEPEGEGLRRAGEGEPGGIAEAAWKGPPEGVTAP